MENKKNVPYYAAFLAGMLLLVGIDQWTKHLAVTYLKGQEAIILIPGVFELSYLENMGAAFGILENMQWVFMIGTCVILAVCVFLFIRLPKERHYLPFIFTASMMAAGGVGNTIDRIVQGYVVDFLYFSLIDFPVFNVADMYVTVGAAVFALFYMLSEEEDFSCLFRKKK